MSDIQYYISLASETIKKINRTIRMANAMQLARFVAGSGIVEVVVIEASCVVGWGILKRAPVACVRQGQVDGVARRLFDAEVDAAERRGRVRLIRQDRVADLHVLVMLYRHHGSARCNQQTLGGAQAIN